MPTPAPTTIVLNGHSYEVKEQVGASSLTEVYRVEFEAGGPADGPGKTVFDRLLDDDIWSTSSALAHITLDPANNDLAANGAVMLGQLWPPGAAEEKFRRYLPRLLDHGTHAGRAIVLYPLYPGYVSMAEVKRSFPDGLDFRDVVWQWKRCLAALWYVHKEGLVCGGMTPNNLFVHPVEHGAKIMEWSYAALTRGRIRAADMSYADFLAPEILRKLEAHPATDLYMLAKSVLWMLGGDVKTDALPDRVPGPLADFLQGCLVKDRTARPNDAGKVHEDLDALLLKVVGKPSYRRLVLPPPGV